MSQLLKKSLVSAPVVYRGTYPYLIHPLSDGFPWISPDLLKEVVYNLEKMIQPFLPFDKIVTIESMGIPIATLLSNAMNIPLTIIRKRCYGLADERRVQQETGYARTHLYINGIEKNDTIILVDDIISTGGTIRAIIQTLLAMDVTLKAGFVVIDKGKNTKEIMKQTGVPIHALTHITIQKNKVILL